MTEEMERQESSVLQMNKPEKGDHRGSEELKGVSWLPDEFEDGSKSGLQPMDPTGPWATGKGLNWTPSSGLSGTRPVVDHYSTTRYSYTDWKQNNKNVLGISSDDLYRVNMVEYSGRRAKECIALSADKTQYLNTERVNHRLLELVKWKSEVERALHEISEEIDLLESDRKRLDNARCSLLQVHSISSECMARRAMREGKDLALDKVEEELIKESSLVKEVSDLYIRTLKQIEEQMERNMSLKSRLEADWSDKQETWKLLREISQTKTDSQTIMFKPAATRFCENQCSEEGWERNTKELLVTADAVKQQSVALRSMINITILQGCARDLKAQADAVDMALARRLTETDESVKAMTRELEVIIRKGAETERLIADLKEGIRNLDMTMKVSQTRLELMQRRPRAENCRDEAQFGLVDEVRSLGEQVSQMRIQLQEGEDALQAVIKSRGFLEREIQIKLKTIHIDNQRCQVMRAQYPTASSLTGN